MALCEKYYIVSSPCQGKTTFIKKHKGKYGDYRLYDYDNLKVRDYRCLEKLPSLSVVLGGDHELNTDTDFTMSSYIVVQIPLEKLLSNLAHRQENPQPKRKQPDPWASEHKVLDAYNKLGVLVNRGDIPVFDCFEQAMEFVTRHRS